MKNILKLYLLNILFISVCFSRLEAVTWGTLTNISPSDLVNMNPKIALDPNGNAMAVWDEDTGTGYNQIMAIHYTSGVWDVSPTALSLIGPPGGNSYMPDVSMDSSGNAMAIWERTNGTTLDVQVAFYTQFTNTWSSPLNISPSNQQAITPEFSFNAAGDGIAVWHNVTTQKIQAAIYTQFTNTWSAASNISVTMPPTIPHLAINAAGKAIVVWLADTGTTIVVQANVYDGTAWGTETTISESALDSVHASVAIDQAGNGIAIWKDVENDRIKVANYNQSLATWSSVVTISPSIQMASKPSISIVPSTGNAVAIWRYFNGTVHLTAGATYTFSTSTWSSSTILSILGESIDDLKVVVDSLGNAVAVWRRFNGPDDIIIRASSYDSGTNTWSAPQSISLAGIAGPPHVFINTSAATFEVFVVWRFTTDNVNYVIQAINSNSLTAAPFYRKWLPKWGG